MKLNGKTAVLTGASSGLGKVVARTLIEHGAKVYGLARNMEALSQLREELGRSFTPVRLDIGQQDKVKNWVDRCFNRETGPDILINNAGAGSFKKIDDMQDETWLKMINTNLNGLYFLTAPLVALMKQKETSSHIINIGSVLGKVGRAEGTAYCTTKFGVNGFSEALFKELRFENIKVTCLNSGSIDTQFFKTSGVDSHHNMLQPADLADTIVHLLQTPDNMLINELTVRPLNPKPPK